MRYLRPWVVGALSILVSFDKTTRVLELRVLFFSGFTQRRKECKEIDVFFAVFAPLRETASRVTDYPAVSAWLRRTARNAAAAGEKFAQRR